MSTFSRRSFPFELLTACSTTGAMLSHCQHQLIVFHVCQKSYLEQNSTISGVASDFVYSPNSDVDESTCTGSLCGEQELESDLIVGIQIGEMEC